MTQNPVPALVLAVALSACTEQPEALNSERIERRFGSYGIEILEQDDHVRRSSLYSMHNGVKICRTYAVVRFVDSDLMHTSDAHSRIVDGASIGATFKDDGWTIRKETVYLGEIGLTEAPHDIAELMALESAAQLATHAYEFHIDKAETSIHYATIVELHHPDYLDLEQLHELFGDANAAGTVSPDHIRQLVLDQHPD